MRTHSNANDYAPMCKLHRFFYYFPPARGKCEIVCTSVIGHIFSTDFVKEGSGSDPVHLFGTGTCSILTESSLSQGICEHLEEAAQGCEYLFLWLDCDREGGNICFEVMSVLSHAGCCPRPSNVYRAKFSSLTERDIKASFGRPQKPDENQSNECKEL